MKVMWWEKTVEYQFVLETSKRRSGGLLTPFDGNHEQAGDAIFADTSNRWLLIEFKRDERQLDSEVIKFHDYRLAADELGADDAHHQLAFGLLDSESKLTLAFCTYFSRQAIEGIESALDLGTSHEILKAYVARLIELKRGPGGGGPGGVALQSFETVLGVSSSGDVIATMSMREFASGFASPYADPPKAKKYRSAGM